ncbi:MAG: protoheme IX farnesyltransferase [Gemmatimonadetes bacterium]|nr:protoheme IX farnesyltransferase [Gemmatimonadota bacterium]
MSRPPSASTEQPVPGRTRSQALAYYELTKPGIAGFAMITAGVAYYVASAGDAGLVPVFHTLLGTVLATAGALALNQYIERKADALMERTRTRPLPSGRLRPRDALLFGLLLVVGGVAHLWATVGEVPAILTLLSAGTYNLVYTPLKPRSHTATFAGAVPGAMPALIGWSAATGGVGPGALVLFGIAFLWQIPHVLSLAWLLREDYARAGFLMMPPTSPDGRFIGSQMVLYSAALLPVSLFPTPLGLTGWIYLIGAAVLGTVFLWWSIAASRSMDRTAVRRVFLGSLAYQPLLLGLMLLDTVRN